MESFTYKEKVEHEGEEMILIRVEKQVPRRLGDDGDDLLWAIVSELR
jgi:hypothetical protein